MQQESDQGGRELGYIRLCRSMHREESASLRYIQQFSLALTTITAIDSYTYRPIPIQLVFSPFVDRLIILTFAVSIT